MTTNTALKTAIFQAVNTFATTNSLPCSFPGVSFTKPATGEWLELSVVTNDRDFGLNDSIKFRRGIVQINVCGIKDRSGDLALQAIADLIESGWQRGDVLTGGIRVSTNPLVEEAIIRDSTDYILPVSFEYEE